MNLSYATSSLLASSSSSSSPPPPGICDTVKLVDNIIKTDKTRSAWAVAECGNVQELVEVYNDKDGNPRMKFDEMLEAKQVLPWTKWESVQQALGGSARNGRPKIKYTVRGGKLHYGDKEVLPIEEWRRVFVHVYNTEAQFAQMRSENRAMDRNTANKVADIMFKTIRINKTLLAACILATYSPPTDNDTAAVEPLLTLQPDVPTLEEDQPNAAAAAAATVEPLLTLEPDVPTLEEDQPNAVVATTDRAANVANALVPTRTSARDSHRMGFTSPRQYPSTDQIQSIVRSAAPGSNNNFFFGGNHYNQTSNTDNGLLEQINTTTKDTLSRTKDIEARGYDNTRVLNHLASSTKKAHPARTQARDIGVLGRSGSVDENMVAGGSPLRSMNEFDTGTGGESPESHGSYVHDIGGRELFGASGEESMAQEQGSGEHSSTSKIATLGAFLGNFFFG